MLSMGGIGNAIVIQKMCHTWIFFVWDAACTYTEHRINQWILVRIKKIAIDVFELRKSEYSFFTHAQAASPILENYFWFRFFVFCFSVLIGL